MKVTVKSAALHLLVAVIVPVTAVAQEQEPPTRAELIEQERREKRARLWPESQSPIAAIATDFVERGLLDGIETGLGSNGIQFIMGGMRSGQGLSIGVGYRRSDLWRERFGFRTTVRGTPQLAWMVDAQLYFPHLQTERGFLDIYSKYEYSPQMDFYGQGQNSDLDDRSSYRLEDLDLVVRGGWEFYRFLRIGGTTGGYYANIGSGTRSDVPSVEDVFPEVEIPGFGENGEFFRTGVFVELDYRDRPKGARSGGDYRLEWTQYWDITQADQYNFRRLDATLEQYIPYFNKTRVIAIRLWAKYTWTNPGQRVPFYMQPYIGGNDDLRGFARYRFYADNSFVGTIEHRWHAFSGMDAALFVDVGKVAERADLLYASNLRGNAGIGFRFKMRGAVIMRIDQAVGTEGYRFMWTFSDIF